MIQSKYIKFIERKWNWSFPGDLCSRGLLVADKSSDVYLFSTEGEKDGQLLLGIKK